MEKTISSQKVFQGRVITLRVDTVEMPGGRRSTREIIEHPPCIAALAIDEGGNILLVKQYRKAIDGDLLEIPAGGIDAGETPEEATIREMREETGYLPRRIERLCGFYSSPGYSNEFLHLFLVNDLVPSPLTADDSEGIKLVRVAPAEISGLLRSGRILDGKSIAALLIYQGMVKSKEKAGC